ncbi:DivIVA domain-containing protein [Agromyces seonyuensis]|uniref:Antigen 84 n=1 Tax=Agromyces seonyuensis TaxID=2662446 RepID=A0A6I4P2V7_9MICO|nr:hypothetical protein [Agromyces seonyuensis]MWB98459.1 hypothetical protein [Agromyces seonyuensis]
MIPSWNDVEPQIPTPPAQEGDLVGAVSRLPEIGTVGFLMRQTGGYDRLEVDEFLSELGQTVDAVRTALEQDRRELAELRAENLRLLATNDAELEHEVTLGAVGLLSQAQVIADKAVADAEQYARDLVLTARAQYRERMEQHAAAAQEESDRPEAGAPAAPAPSIPEIEFVRTYAQVAQIQLRSVLDALTEQVDRLGTLPHPEPLPVATVAAAESAPAAATADESAFDGEPDWLPAVPPRPTMGRSTYITP